MKKPTLNFIWQKTYKYLINKYLITFSVFAVIICFVGDHSLLNRVKMAHQISKKEAELRENNARSAKMQKEIDALDEPGALEKFAREEYYMRAPGEDVYIIEE